MNTDRKWVIVRIDGKITAISTDYRLLAEITAKIAGEEKGKKGSVNVPYGKITADTVSFEQVWDLRHTVSWDDFMLFGTDFQKRVWGKLWELTRQQREGHVTEARLLSYSDFAELCSNRAGVRAVAHAIGLNPVAVIIPCHLIVPKESIDKIAKIKKNAETTIFKGDDLCINSILNDSSIDFGEYSHGRGLKRMLIRRELTGF